MAEIESCLPYGMEREVRQMQREGWRIHSVRADTLMMVASFKGSSCVFRWDGEEESLKLVLDLRDVVEERP